MKGFLKRLAFASVVNSKIYNFLHFQFLAEYSILS